MFSLGGYPEVGLKDARDRRDQARKLLAQGVDPSEAKKQEKASEAGEDTFEHVAREYLTKTALGLTPGYVQEVEGQLAREIFPFIGSRPIKEVTAPELLATIRRVESRGANDLARKVLQKCGQVFRYAIATGQAERNPAADLRGPRLRGNPKRGSEYQSGVPFGVSREDEP